VQPGTNVRYDVAVTNNDIGACQPNAYEFFFQQVFPPGDGGFGSTTTTTGGFGGSPIDMTTGSSGGSAGSSETTTGSFDGGSMVTTTTASGSGGFGGASGSGGSGGSFGGKDGSGGSSSSGGSAGSGGSGGGGSSSNTGIVTSVTPTFFFDVQPGTTVTFQANVSSTEDAEPGVHHVPFDIFSFSKNFESLQGELIYELAEQTGCFVRTKRELMITSTSVVDDPVRTTFDAIPTDHPQSRGVWTFGRLIRDLAPTPEDAPALTEQLFKTWLTDQTVNGFIVRARPDIQRVVLNNWPRTADGKLDLDRSPLRLQAIVNRIDLRNLANGNAGEGRFVFGVLGPFGAEQFTVILEYKLPAETPEDVMAWANLWHGLSGHPFPSEEYNAALEQVTLRFSGRNAAPGRVNGSALGQLRTNEIALFPRWEFREFMLSADAGFFQESTVKLTPDLAFNGSSTLADFVNQNEAAIIAETHTVPEQFEGRPFLAGSVFNDLIFWSAPGIRNNEARHHLSLNTCNGCHGPETNTTFLQISPRFFQGSEAVLSPFLTGTSVFDPFSGQVRTLNDLARRNADLKQLVCAAQPLTAPTPSAAGATTLQKGIQRVH